MGTKDVTENYLEAYNDVFADIVNVLLFNGEEKIAPDQLTNAATKAVYKADGKVHEEERDIAKFWLKNRIRIAIYGIENQTDIHPYMPLRVMGYDGAAYREQILMGSAKDKYPVITLVLYFGTEHEWNSPLSLLDCVDVPEELIPYFSDYRINVFNIAFLPDETIRKFKSDFGIVADYFSQIRKNKDYVPSKEEIKHVDAVLKLLSVLTDDDRFEEAQQTDPERRVKNMCEVMERAVNKGREEGRSEGRNEIIKQLLSSGIPAEQIASAVKIPLAEIKNIEAEMLQTV